jgi:hypothetical protein
MFFVPSLHDMKLLINPVWFGINLVAKALAWIMFCCARVTMASLYPDSDYSLSGELNIVVGSQNDHEISLN